MVWVLSNFLQGKENRSSENPETAPLFLYNLIKTAAHSYYLKLRFYPIDEQFFFQLGKLNF